jgi:hypothetical protein
MTKPGWGAVVQGEPTDLQGWTDNLKEPFDPWVEIHGGETVLRSALLDGLATANAVRGRAPAYIDRINGAMALSQLAGPLRFGERVIQLQRMASSTAPCSHKRGASDSEAVVRCSPPPHI